MLYGGLSVCRVEGRWAVDFVVVVYNVGAWSVFMYVEY